MQTSPSTTKIPPVYFQHIFTALCIITILGFFIGRALVSVGSIVLAVAVLYQYGVKATLRQFWAFKWNVFALLLLLTSALSYFWSDNTASWEADTVTKLSLLVLPLGFSVPLLNKQQVVKTIVYALNVFITLTIINSLYIYALDVEKAQEGYMLVTTVYGDHIRFSFVIALTILLNLFLVFEHSRSLAKSVRWLLGLASLLSFAYLHLLSARTGLLCAYTGIGLLLLVKAWKRKKVLALGVLVGLCLVPLVAMQLSPRLASKVAFMLHEVTTVSSQSAAVQFNYSDNNRVLSYAAAINSIVDYPLLGVGSGDLRSEMRKQYQILYPDVPLDGSLEVPHLQLLSTVMAIGIPLGVLCIIGLLLSPLWHAQKHRLYVYINALLMLIFFSIDANLEVQFGILVIVFYTQLWYLLASSSVKDTGKTPI